MSVNDFALSSCYFGLALYNTNICIWVGNNRCGGMTCAFDGLEINKDVTQLKLTNAQRLKVVQYGFDIKFYKLFGGSYEI